jgi:5-methylcytosine-specific restriction endonuclease McrA
LANERWRTRFESDPQRSRDVQREWRLANPDRARATWANRRARRKGAEGSHTAEDLKAIYAAQGGKCAVCHASLRDRKELDHITPLVSGGSNWPSNLQYLCRSCNRSKGAKDPHDFARRRGLLL